MPATSFMSVVELRYEGSPGDTEWVCYFKDLPSLSNDHVGKQYKPDGLLNYFYYPTKIGKKKAVERLTKAMAAEHKKQLSSLGERLEKLEQLTCPQL